MSVLRNLSRSRSQSHQKQRFLFRKSLRLERLEERCVLAQTVGTFINEPGAFQGYTLFSPSLGTDTYLVDMQGREVNRWESQYPPMSTYLEENGDMIRMARLPQNAFPAGGAAGRIERFNWEGDLVWFYELNTPNRILHHDFEVLPNGNILAIVWEKRTGAAAIANGRNPALLPQNEIWPDSIIEIQPTGSSGGNIVWEWHLWDHLVQDFDPSQQNYGSVSANPQLVNINYVPTGAGAGDYLADWTHFNSIDYNPQLDQIMISSREFSELWIIDHSTTTAEAAGHTGGRSGKGGDLLYRYGNPAAYDRGTRADQKFFYQHDAQWIEPGLPGAGNILVFNNGWNRVDGSSYSSVIELTPPENHQWYLNDLTDGSTTQLNVFDTGAVSPNLIQLTGDWNGDGRDTGGYYDPANQRFRLNNLADGSTNTVVLVQYAGVGANWKPIVGDWDGDGDDTPGFYDPATETWRLYNTLAGASETPIVFNTPAVPNNWIPVTGDWNGDTRDSVGLYDPVNHTFYLNNNINGSIAGLITFVTPPVPATWLPVAGDWNNDGFDTVGLYNPNAYTWYLNNRVDGSITDMITVTTPPVPASWRPLVGDWNGDGRDTIGLFNPTFVNNAYTLPPGGAYGPTNYVWQYVAPNRNTFFAPIISGAQRLPNGNTLINEGTEGHFFEVTPSKQVVWRYISPVIATRPLNQGETVPTQTIVGIPGVQQNFVFRALRYGVDYAGLDGRDLTPGSTLEINPIAYESVGLYDPNNARWYLNNQVNGTVNDLVSFTTPPVPANWIAISGDWDGDGVTTIGLYNPLTSDWYLNNRVDGSINTVIHFQTPPVPASWIPVVGDWDGDGDDTVGLYDPNSDTWYLNNEIDGSIDTLIIVHLPPVPSNWKPIVGDWDGDGFDTPGLYDPVGNNWYLNNRIDGSTTTLVTFHTPTVPNTWRPLAGDWDGDGFDTVGLYDPSTSSWYLNNRIDGSINTLISFRTPPVPFNWQPIIGDWNGPAPTSFSPAGEQAPLSYGLAGRATRSSDWLDVNSDGLVTPLDAALIINNLNAGGFQATDAVLDKPIFGDTNGDMLVTPLDALLVINYLNSVSIESQIDLIADDVAYSSGTYSDSASSDAPEEELAVIGHQAVLAALYQMQQEDSDRQKKSPLQWSEL